MTTLPSGGARRAPPAARNTKAGISVLAFDLDGTLVDSVPDLAWCLGRALEDVGLPAPSEAETSRWVGDGVDELVRRALVDRTNTGKADSGKVPDALVAATVDAFSRCYADHLFVRSRLYPGTVETLDALAARGLRLCCVTNKRLRYALSLLEQAGILNRFEVVIGGDSVPEKKPSPMPLHAAAERLGISASAGAFVGDSEQDMKAARAAGWRFVWASYGYRRIDPSERDAAFTIDALPDLIDHL